MSRLPRRYGHPTRQGSRSATCYHQNDMLAQEIADWHGGRRMRIDWHVHINDPKYMEPKWWKHPVPMTLEHALDAHHLVGLDRTVISNAVHYIRFCETPKEALAAIESSNRYLAKCRADHPHKFVAMATCIPGGGDADLKELERAVKQDDARA